MSSSVTVACPSSAAMKSAERPCSSSRLTLHRASISWFVTYASPFLAAAVRGVCPLCAAISMLQRAAMNCSVTAVFLAAMKSGVDPQDD
jgi:hypothetical protein